MIYNFININYFTNILINLITLGIFFGNSLIISNILEKKNIFAKRKINWIIIFYLIFIFYCFLFNFLLFFDYHKYLFLIVYFFILIQIIFNLVFFRHFKINNYKSFFSLIKKEKFLIFISLILFLIVALPISDADSIASHFYFPFYVSNHGLSNLNVDQYFEFLSFANSEILLFFSVSLKNTNFGAYLNFFSLMIFLYTFRKKKYFIFGLLSVPLIIFFISTQKLQLFFGLLYLIIFIIIHEKIIKNKIELFILTSLICFYSSGKLSYILLAIPLYFYFIYQYRSYFKDIILYGVISFIFILFPIFLVKYLYFKNPFAPFLDFLFYNPSRNTFDLLSYSLRSSEGWLNNLSNYKIYIKPFFPTSLSELSNGLGLLFLFSLINFNLLKKLKYFPIIIIVIVISTGQILPRYYYESFLILIYYYNFLKKKFLVYISNLQLSFVIIFSIIFIYFSYFEHNVVFNQSSFLKKNAFHYYNMNNLNNKKIQENILILNLDRMNIFSQNNYFPARLINLKKEIDVKNYENYLIDFIKLNKISYIIGNKNSLPSCINLKKIDEIEFKSAKRNLFINENFSKQSIYQIKKINCG